MVHLGHDRGVVEIVDAAVQEDVQGVAVSSYQGGHVEYFGYLVDAAARARRRSRAGLRRRRRRDRARPRSPPWTSAACRIFSPEDGQRLGLPGMVNTMIAGLRRRPRRALPGASRRARRATDGRWPAPSPCWRRAAAPATCWRDACAPRPPRAPFRCSGITGTGGSGKSSLTDELLRRLRLDQEDKLRIAVLAVDPTRRRGGGALLGDRIRMNALAAGRAPSSARWPPAAPPAELPAAPAPTSIAACQAAGYDLVIVETPGIGQGDVGDRRPGRRLAVRDDAGVRRRRRSWRRSTCSTSPTSSRSTSSSAAAREDARRDVARQLVRNREAFGAGWEDMPVFGTSAARFDDDGVTALYQHLRELLAEHGLPVGAGRAARGRRQGLDRADGRGAAGPGALPRRDRRARSAATTTAPARARRRRPPPPAPARPRPAELGGRRRSDDGRVLDDAGRGRADASWTTAPAARSSSGPQPRQPVPRRRPRVHRPRPGARHAAAAHDAVRHQPVPRVALPRTQDHGELVRVPARRRTCPGRSRSPPGSSRSSGTPRHRPGCSPARATPSAPTGASTCCRPGSPRPGCRPRSTPSRCTGATPPSGPTSTARSAPPGSRSPPSTT